MRDFKLPLIPLRYTHFSSAGRGAFRYPLRRDTGDHAKNLALSKKVNRSYMFNFVGAEIGDSCHFHREVTTAIIGETAEIV